METQQTSYTDLGAIVRITAFVPAQGIAEYHMMVTLTTPDTSITRQIDSILAAYERAHATLPTDTVPVFKRYFLSDATNQAYRLPKDDTCAVSVVGQPPLNGTKVALWVYLQQGMTVRRHDDGLYSAAHGSYTHLWKASMGAPDLSSEVATIALLGDYAGALSRRGCSLADNCMRTWFFVHDVDINYAGMVRGRNKVFDCSGLTLDTHFIASTGIGGKNPDPRALVTFDAYAVDGLDTRQVRYLTAPTHLNPTYEYGVAFERGTAIEYGDRRHVLISGTASINNRGEVEHRGDIVRQTDRMFDNIGALLASADCDWTDVTHGIVYLRDIADYSVVADILQRRFPTLPLVIVLAPVCRPEWLIEMECMAIKDHTSDFAVL